MTELEPLNDLQQYHSLQNEITDLKELLRVEKRSASYARQMRNKQDVLRLRMNKARVLFELKNSGHIDWSRNKISSECSLSYNRIRVIEAEVLKSTSLTNQQD